MRGAMLKVPGSCLVDRLLRACACTSMRICASWALLSNLEWTVQQISDPMFWIVTYSRFDVARNAREK